MLSGMYQWLLNMWCSSSIPYPLARDRKKKFFIKMPACRTPNPKPAAIFRNLPDTIIDFSSQTLSCGKTWTPFMNSWVDVHWVQLELVLRDVFLDLWLKWQTWYAIRKHQNSQHSEKHAEKSVAITGDTLWRK